MEIKEINSRSCLSKCGISGIDYTINPYVGCQHGCKYCYADFIKKFRNIKKDWGDFVYIKKDCGRFLDKELDKNKEGHIWMSSVCDCYMPVERDYKLTRDILNKILEFKEKFSLEIITKSCLVERDFNILKDIDSELGMSINSLDENITKIIEPLASKPFERLETLKKAQKQGIRVFAFISPVLPGITDLEALFKELQFCSYVWVELLNTKFSVLKKLKSVYEKHFPNNMKYLEFAINHPNKYYQEIKEKAEILSNKYSLDIKGIVRHNKLK